MLVASTNSKSTTSLSQLARYRNSTTQRNNNNHLIRRKAKNFPPNKTTDNQQRNASCIAHKPHGEAFLFYFLRQSHIFNLTNLSLIYKKYYTSHHERLSLPIHCLCSRNLTLCIVPTNRYSPHRTDVGSGNTSRKSRLDAGRSRLRPIYLRPRPARPIPATCLHRRQRHQLLQYSTILPQYIRRLIQRRPAS